MKMCMDPRGGRGRFVLHDVVSFLPIPPGRVPESLKGRAEARRRGYCREAFSELSGRHGVFGVLMKAMKNKIASMESAPPNQRRNVATRPCANSTANAAAKEIFSIIAAIMSSR